MADHTTREASYPAVKKRMVGYREPNIRYAPEADIRFVTQAELSYAPVIEHADLWWRFGQQYLRLFCGSWERDDAALIDDD